MTPKQLVKEIAKREGLKKSVDIAQIQEIVGHLADIIHEEGGWMSQQETAYHLGELGLKREHKRQRAESKK